MLPFVSVPRRIRVNHRHGGRRCIGVSLGFAWVVLITGTAQAAPGDLDPIFGEGGWAITESGDYLKADAALLQPDDKIVVIGSAANVLAAWRLMPDGSQMSRSEALDR